MSGLRGLGCVFFFFFLPLTKQVRHSGNFEGSVKRGFEKRCGVPALFFFFFFRYVVPADRFALSNKVATLLLT